MRLFVLRGLIALILTNIVSAGEVETDHPHASTTSPAEALGHVAFINSCQSDVQETFERGVALLHSFWWSEGDKAFTDVLKRDPNCAIAAWGIAAILIGNPFSTGPTTEQAKRAAEILEAARAIKTTQRERMFIEAVGRYYDKFGERTHAERLKALSDAFAELAQRFPDDDEAQIFAALYLSSTQDPADKTFAATLQAASVLEIQFKKHPDHPGVAHYLIHGYDYPPIAAKGLSAARRYAAIAPSAPHALHMPSHIFTRVGAWQDSITSNVQSAKVAAQKKETVDQLHAMDYLEYAYLQMARDRQAQSVMQDASHIPVDKDIRAAPYASAAIPARYLIERGKWAEAAQLEAHESQFPYTIAFTYFARALGAARSGDAAAAERDIQALVRIGAALKTAGDSYWSVEVEVERLSAAAWTALARKHGDAALELMRAAAALEDQSEKSAITPGRLLPAHELLADMLLEMDQPGKALSEYELAQVRDPNRFRSLYGAGRAAELAGDRAKAAHYYSRLIAVAGDGDPRPEINVARAFLGHD